MSDEHETAGGPGDEEFRLPLPGEDEGHRIRRRLFGGLRPDDVQKAISSRDEAIALLRRDMAALWLAFGQHERTITEMLEALERLGAGRIDPPGGRADRRSSPTSAVDQDPATGRESATASALGEAMDAADAGALGAQLAGLDEVLSAIEHATHSLEKAYADDVAESGDDPGDPEQTGGEGEDPRDADDADSEQRDPA